MPEFSFFLIHVSGYRVLGAGKKEGNGYCMFRLHHPDAQVYDPVGERKDFRYVGGMANDEIQTMIESGEWEIARSNPFEE